MSFQYDYPRPAVTVDMIIISNSIPVKILLIKRLRDPFAGFWALPGGFVDEQEDLMDAALRELEEETQITGVSLTQFKTYGTPHRDPRGHVVSVVFFGNQAFRFIIHQVGDPLLGFEVEFHPKTFVIGINKAERVAAETVHMAPGARKAAVAEINR